MKNMLGCLTLLLITSMGYGQATGTVAFDYAAELSRSITIPNSPETAAFIKYGDIPLNHYTGTPNISIPICEIKGRSISMPISMTYDASGIKVNQLATNVGLGWNLNYGGVVSRQVNGLADQGSGGYAKITDPATRRALNVLYDNSQMAPYSSAQDFDDVASLLENYGLNNIDLHADIFSFSINGLSGTIGINYDVIENGKYQVFCIEDPTLKIDYTITGSSIEEISSWIITDTQGTIYTFDKKEYTESAYSQLNNPNEYISEYVSSWYISNITTANNEDTITYHYSAGEYYFRDQYLPKQVIWEYYFDPVRIAIGQDPETTLKKNVLEQHSPTVYRIKRFNLSYILHNNKIAFSAQSNFSREDLEGQSAISDLSIYNTLGETTKSFVFDYTYFTTGSSSQQVQEKYKRLKLDAIREIEVLRNGDGTIIPSDITPKEKTHHFEYYNPDSMPARDSQASDLWGYYNGKQSSHMVPGNKNSFSEQIDIPEQQLEVLGADRRAYLNFTKNGTLKKITYPTGGSTAFYYDAHKGPQEERTVLTSRPFGPVSLVGGHDNGTSQTTVDLDQCPNVDDIGYLYNLQNSNAGAFTIDKNNADTPIIFDITYTEGQTGQIDNNDVLFLAIYKSRLGTGCETRACPEGDLQPNGCSLDIAGDTYEYCDTGESPLGYCDLMEMGVNDPKILYMSTNPLSDITLELPEGDYRYLLVNGFPDTVLSLNFDLLAENDVINTVGGLRLHRTKSTSNTPGELPITKYYYYDTIPEDTSVTLDMMNDQTSSGIIHQKLIFSDMNMHTGRFESKQSIMCPGIGFDNQGAGPGTYTTYLDGNVYKFYSYNLAPQTRQSITYTHVSEVVFNQNTYEGHSVYSFYNEDNGSTRPNRPYYSKRPLNGKLKTTTHYNYQKKIVQQTSQEYTQQALHTSMPFNGIVMHPEAIFYRACVTNHAENNQFYTSVSPIPEEESCSDPCPVDGSAKSITTYFANKYRFTPVWTRLEATTKRQFFEDQVVEQTTNYFYENDTHKQLTRTQTTKSDGQINISKMYYPQDREQLGTLSVTANKAIDNMIDTHRIGMPLQVEQYNKQGAVNTLLAKQRTDYNLWGSEKQVFPETIYTSKASDSLKERMRYHSYDTYGNPLEVSQTNGIHSIYIWGYNDKYPIAKIDNASYDGMPTTVTNLIDQIKTTSNTENNSTKEATLRSQLETLGSHSFFANAEMSYYTYDPMIGITSITDPRGYTMYYEYDGFNRLSAVKDEDGNILSENQYHYKNN
ncbi:RHS repeat domain-containing protein [uncultured Aquimarina sp.]|uniref:RHS repeat domain-containing protein n=1 Tax=uncultured Aquimarina sp. TaxID=575652 RepID=UPI0026020BE2|nr:RHS repeat domain-containing protein [uncultured Aquimarina sp.]